MTPSSILNFLWTEILNFLKSYPLLFGLSVLLLMFVWFIWNLAFEVSKLTQEKQEFFQEISQYLARCHRILQVDLLLLTNQIDFPKLASEVKNGFTNLLDIPEISNDEKLKTLLMETFSSLGKILSMAGSMFHIQHDNDKEGEEDSDQNNFFKKSQPLIEKFEKQKESIHSYLNLQSTKFTIKKFFKVIFRKR